MHDPSTVAFDIKYPWRQRPSQLWPKGYRSTFITIWHEDPMDFTGKCRGRSDDSCGWHTPLMKTEERDIWRKRSDYEYTCVFSKQHNTARGESFARVCYDPETTYGTLRGRVGYAFDRVLVYATGGLAWGEQDHGFGCDAARVPVTNGCQKKKGGQAFYVSKSPIDIGYTVGGGVEYGITRSWSIKAEYLFTDYGTNRIDLVDPNYPAAKTARNFDTTVHTTKIGVNYRF